MTMPDDQGFWGDKLVDAVKNGSVPETRVDDMAIRFESLCCIHFDTVANMRQNSHLLVSIWPRQGVPQTGRWPAEEGY